MLQDDIRRRAGEEERLLRVNSQLKVRVEEAMETNNHNVETAESELQVRERLYVGSGRLGEVHAASVPALVWARRNFRVCALMCVCHPAAVTRSRRRACNCAAKGRGGDCNGEESAC